MSAALPTGWDWVDFKMWYGRNRLPESLYRSEGIMLNSGFIKKIYVSCKESAETVQKLASGFHVEINRDIFFL